MIAAVTDDFDGQTRSTLTPTDIGADAGSFTLSSDIVPPALTYTPLTFTTSTANRVLTNFATATDNLAISSGANARASTLKKQPTTTPLSAILRRTMAGSMCAQQRQQPI